MERQQKDMVKRRNNELITQTAQEQEKIRQMQRDAKLREDSEFQTKLDMMKQQEQLSKMKQKEYNQMMIKDLHDNYEISKKVKNDKNWL